MCLQSAEHPSDKTAMWERRARENQYREATRHARADLNVAMENSLSPSLTNECWPSSVGYSTHMSKKSKDRLRDPEL